MVGLGTWWFCFLKYFFERHKNIKKGEGSRVVGKTPKINLTHAFKQSSLCVIRIRIRFNPGGLMSLIEKSRTFNRFQISFQR